MPTFSNQATLSYNASTVSSNVVVGEVVSSLNLIKTALSAVYAPGDVVSYVISITNSGTADFTGLTMTDDLGRYEFGDMELVPLTYVEDSARIFINGEPQDDAEVASENPLVIEGIDVPAGGNVMILYSARVNEFAEPCGGTITNTAALDGDCPCSDAADSAEIETVCEARLSIAKQLCPCVITRCDQPVTFSFTVSNTGCCPALANDDVVITDTFDPPITITSVTFNGEEWTEGAYYTYDSETGEFATVSGQVTVPAATYTQDPETGAWTAVPGESILVVTGVFCPGE